MAILVALLSSHVDLKLISICFGNCDTENSLRNTLSLFHVLEQEKAYRQKRDPATKPFVFSTPTVAVGLTTALDGTRMDATYFHGQDGLGNVHKLAPKFTAPEEWVNLYGEQQKGEYAPGDLPFKVSKRPSYELILDVLREEEDDSVIIVAIGPLMNLAKAAEIDPTTFSRVKHIVSMGGALAIPGNVTPYAEFNVFSDALAASKMFDLTSIQAQSSGAVSGKINLTLFPLDITIQHLLYENEYLDFLKSKNYLTADGQLAADVPPLVEWTRVWLNTTFNTFRRIYGFELLAENERPPLGLNMHDPLALWYAINYLDDAEKTNSKWVINRDQDVRIEVEGTLTKGMTVRDLRGKPKRDGVDPDDHGTWLSTEYGNRINVAVSSPYVGPHFGRALLKSLFE